MPGSRVYLEAQGSELRSDVGFSNSFTDYLKVNEKLLIGASARSFYLTAIYLGGRPRHPQQHHIQSSWALSAVLSAAAQRATRARQTP